MSRGSPPCQIQKILQINIFLKELIHKIYTCMLIFVAGYPDSLVYVFLKNRMSQYCYRVYVKGSSEVYRLVSNGGGYKSITQRASHHLEKTSHTRAMLRPFARDTSRNIFCQIKQIRFCAPLPQIHFCFTSNKF